MMYDSDEDNAKKAENARPSVSTYLPSSNLYVDI
jgi:hypothetical protein